ncbi:MAG: tRNA lysidine(34) synthetase TilS [Eubacteriales bacterium]
MEDRILAFLEELPLASGDLLLCALSGGADSVALTLCLSRLMERFPFQLGVAHYNHQLRGAQSDQDADFCRGFVSSLDQLSTRDIPFFLGSGDVGACSAQTGHGVEATAREMRYQFLQETATSIGARFIVTAHTANDNAETLLFHLARGTGTTGLCAIPPRRENIIRPLLNTSREEVEGYLISNDTLYCNDATNQQDVYTRNYIRHHILPLLFEVNPSYLSHISNTISILSSENNYLDGLARESLTPKLSQDTVKILCAQLLALPQALQPRSLQILADHLEISLTFEARSRIMAIARGDHPSARICLPQNCVVFRQYEHLIFSKKKETVSLSPCPLPIGVTTWGDAIIEVKVAPYDPSFSDWIPLPSLPLWVRQRKEGDSFKPYRRHTKSLKKWLVDHKIPKDLRDYLPIITDEGGEILYVHGIGVAEPFFTTPIMGEIVLLLNISTTL